MQTSPADSWFSKCVRLRVNWVCERCGAVHGPSSTGLHCSHIFSRRHRTIRWDGLNTQALCHACHSWYGGNPADSGRWVEQVVGEGVIALLREKMASRVKVPKAEEKEIAAHYRAEYQLLQRLRDAGETGRIEFVSWQ
jgi:NMD protein affecting ribosome stability and mRNA decay